MRKRIVYTEHISLRLRMRSLPRILPIQIVRNPSRTYFDSITKLFIAVKELREGPSGEAKIFLVAFLESDSILKLITIHPLKRNQELNRVSAKRWLRISKKN